ncbi:BLUF domain-containing protein [Palleronia sp. LCG004]|uniref:BLUF domain-containing protein n=1 Tax=Palleronia sp. LCG004 TaxID=3079304 RepID=UPI002942BACC|nr:BLUF domain-containing protein [Palleronia sp. LCG004]WOI58368.1 BLUF domain-containing protein [Palleronia sp. LCG004]
MKYWFYISTARVSQGSGYDALIYLQARNRNRKMGLTGYLHREGDHYAQYVEGPDQAIDTLRATIEKDTRHKKLRLLDEGQNATRRFAGWDMAFTRDETHGFATFQSALGREPDIRRASAADILVFMERMAYTRRAMSVATLAG